ncbi:hypothetical protein GCM10007913_40540 [Devosia yakushimensis]|uniref:LysR substrate-binding domain-containing protein n=1 Tax=Devosia yakushimensis TaxID=470028 RepID=A0ABQ5UJ99_9HYPH|nr:hypothetical protein GCM10007913_40540 [Devosia yakushimensis]
MAAASCRSCIAELNGHALLRCSRINAGETMLLDGPDGQHKVTFGNVMLSDNETILYLAALRGMGLVFLPKWMVHEDILARRLETVFPSAFGFSNTLHADYPSRKYLSAKVRTFIDFMPANLKELR